MKFKIRRWHYGYLFLMVLVGSFISNKVLQLDNDPWWVGTIFSVLWLLVVFVGGSWMWNLLRPYYMTLEDSGISLGKTYYRIDQLELISISKHRHMSLFIKRERFPVSIFPRKTDRDRMLSALEHWAKEHGVSVEHR